MNRYLEQKILMADPVELIQMIYQVAISAVRDARVHLREERIAQRTRAINDACAAITQLNIALRPEAAPEMTTRMRELYLYIQRRLVQGNREQSDAPLAEALSLLCTLAEGWVAVVETKHSEGKTNVAIMHPAPERLERLALSA